MADLRKIGCLPDKLQSGQAGVQVAWALIAKTLPPRVVHLLRAHPVSETAELTEILQEGLQDAVRQLIGIPSTTADQLAVARLPVSAGGLGLPHLPSLAVIARCAALATMPRASDTALYRQALIDSESSTLFHRLRDVCDREPSTLAGNLVDPPPGSASDISVASLLTPAILRLSMLCGFVVLSYPRHSVMLGPATCLGTTRPGRKPTTARVTGYIPCQAGGPTHFLMLCFAGGSSNELGCQPQGQGNHVVVHPQGENVATISLTRWLDMRVYATKGYTPADTTECVTTLLSWPARRD